MANRPLKRFNIVVSARKYIDRDGNEKTIFRRIGELTTWEGGGISVELYHMPGARISAFEQKPRDDAFTPRKEDLPTVSQDDIPVVENEGLSTGTSEAPTVKPEGADSTEDIKVKDIPF